MNHLDFLLQQFDLENGIVILEILKTLSSRMHWVMECHHTFKNSEKLTKLRDEVHFRENFDCEQ